MYKIKLFGLGGQGLVTAAKMLSHAVCIYEDKYAKTVPAYGHERRGAPVFSDLVVSEDKILLNSFVYEPDYILLFDPSVTEKGVDFAKGAHSETICIVNTDDSEVYESIKKDYNFKEVRYVNATQIAIDTIGRDTPNTAMMGAFASTEVVDIESVMKTLQETFKGKAGEANAKAAKTAFDRIKKA